MADITQPPRRFVTGHTSSGSATILYENTVPQTVVGGDKQDAPSAKFSVLWQAKQPNDNTSPCADASLIPVSIARGDGSVCRVVDFAPHHSSQMHRTISLDYGIVVAGDGMEMELENVDGGPNLIRKLKVGDVVVQRGTNHAWHNRGDTWGRMVYVLLAAEKIQLNGKVIEPVSHDIKDGRLG
jgi:quercetin dioxygenase-like cupin family protein